MQHPEVERSDLREYLDVLRARKWAFILVFALVLGLSLAFSYRQTPQYVAGTRMLVAGIPTDTGGIVSIPHLGTEGEVLESVEVAELVKKDLGVGSGPEELLGGVSATPVSDTQVLSITYSSEDPQFAADAANAFANAYITFKQEGARDALLPLIENLNEKKQNALDRLEKLERRIETTQNPDEAALLEQTHGQLEAEVDLLEDKVDAALGTEAAIALGGGTVLQPSSPPAEPSSPDHKTNGIIGGIFGIIFGLAAAFARDRLDNRFRSRVDAEKTLAAPVLATVPKFKVPRGDRSILVADPRGSASESYRTLRTNLQFLAGQQNAKSIVITSPSSSEGKTVTTVNLAIALAQAGQRVVVVSADLRRPTIERLFGVDGQPHGLSTWLSGQINSLDSVIVPANVENIAVVPCGPIPERPAELLTSERLDQLIRLLSERADVVLFDSVPTLAVADAAILSSRADASVLVIDSSSTHRPAAVHSKEELERVGGSLLGVVLNFYDVGGGAYYYYNYYGSKPSLASGNGNGVGRQVRSSGRRSLFGRRR